MVSRVEEFVTELKKYIKDGAEDPLDQPFEFAEMWACRRRGGQRRLDLWNEFIKELYTRYLASNEIWLALAALTCSKHWQFIFESCKAERIYKIESLHTRLSEYDLNGFCKDVVLLGPTKAIENITHVLANWVAGNMNMDELDQFLSNFENEHKQDLVVNMLPQELDKNNKWYEMLK